MYHQIIAICCQTVKMLLPSCCQAIKLSSMLSSALLSTSAPKSTTFHQASISTRVTSIKSPNHKLVTGVFKIFVCGQSPKGMKWILNPNLCPLSRFSVVDRKYIFQNSNVYAVYEDGSNIFTEHWGEGGFIDFNKQKIRKKLTSIKVYNLLRTQTSSIRDTFLLTLGITSLKCVLSI